MPKLTNIATDPDILAGIMAPWPRLISSGQAASQEVSFVYGNLPHKSDLSREDVRAQIRARSAGPA